MRQRITQETIERVKQAGRLSDIISKDTRVVEKGRNERSVKAFCPFHNDVNNASMRINNEQGVWHCFTCDAGGNLFQYVMQRHNVSFGEAVEYLADVVGITVEYVDEAAEQEESRRRIIYRMLIDAQEFFQEQLKKAPASNSYLLFERQLKKSTITAWELGYAPKGNVLMKHLRSKGYTYKDMLAAGLVGQNEHEETPTYYDMYRDRITFPIKDTFGKIISFSGRAMKWDKDSKYGKYLNGPETEVFKKKDAIFGIDMARTAIGKEDEVFLLEGQMDVIAMWQAGMKNVVAALGTAIGRPHLYTLGRFTKNVYLCLDGDKAGIAAAKRVFTLIDEKASTRFYAIQIPADKANDPDEFVMKHGIEAFDELRQNAETVQMFVVRTLLESSDLTKPNERDRAYGAATAFIRDHVNKFNIQQGTEVSNYIIHALHMPVDAAQVYHEIFGQAKKPLVSEEEEDVVEDDYDELALIKILLDYPETIKQFENKVHPDFFDDEDVRGVYERILEKRLNGEVEISESDFENQEQKEIWSKMLTLPSQEFDLIFLAKMIDFIAKNVKKDTILADLKRQLADLEMQLDENPDLARDITRLRIQIIKHGAE